MIADRARCAPWELEDRPVYWRDRVHLAMQAENRARATVQKREAARAKLRHAAGGR